jgi:excisionase family DNA binding protein
VALEGPDERISLKRAAELTGLHPDSLRLKVHEGRLYAEKPGRDWVTTRRHLHAYLTSRGHGMVKPLPADYQPPEGS